MFKPNGPILLLRLVIGCALISTAAARGEQSSTEDAAKDYAKKWADPRASGKDIDKSLNDLADKITKPENSDSSQADQNVNEDASKLKGYFLTCDGKKISFVGVQPDWKFLYFKYGPEKKYTELPTRRAKEVAFSEGGKRVLITLHDGRIVEAIDWGCRVSMGSATWPGLGFEYLYYDELTEEVRKADLGIAKISKIVFGETARFAPIYSQWPFDTAEAVRRQKETAEFLGLPVEESVSLGDGMKLELVLIPAGEFEMGSPEDEKGREKWEGPVHRVRITKPFYIGKYEVTNEQWEQITGETATKWKELGTKRGTLPRKEPAEICWDDCRGFLKMLNAKIGGRQQFRLPTEAEWEYACRAGTGTPYFFGETISEKQAGVRRMTSPGVWNRGLGPVGKFPANAWGLHDMHGNAGEWCNDGYDPYYYRNSPRDNPLGPNQTTGRVVRGVVSEPNGGEEYRSASRGGLDATSPDARNSAVGMRVVAVIGADTH